MLPPTSPREALFACPPFPSWNLPSFTVHCLPPFPLHAPAPTPLSLAKVRLSPTLTFSPVIIWYSGLTALFLFLLAKAVPAYLPTAISLALKPLPFQQAQYVQVFRLKPAPFCTLFAGLGSTNKPATSVVFSDYLTLVLSSLPSFFYQELSPVLSDYNGSPDTRFSWGALLAPSAIPCSLSFLISRFHFSRTGGVLSHLNSSTHRFPRFPPRNLCSLVKLAVFCLVYAATDTAFS